MKPVFIIGNWKSHKNSQEAQEWMEQAKGLLSKYSIGENKTVVLCVPFTLLPIMSSLAASSRLPLRIGAQDVSPYDPGAYTGAINAEQLKEFATHVIVGHSERRRFFGETDEVLAEKVSRVLKAELTPIYLVQSEQDPIPAGITIVGYEPVGAIGTGHPDTPENAEAVAKKIKEKNSFVEYVLYGGSVTAENVVSFTKLSQINGVIPGGASLTPEGFFQLIEHA